MIFKSFNNFSTMFRARLILCKWSENQRGCTITREKKKERKIEEMRGTKYQERDKYQRVLQTIKHWQLSTYIVARRKRKNEEARSFERYLSTRVPFVSGFMEEKTCTRIAFLRFMLVNSTILSFAQTKTKQRSSGKRRSIVITVYAIQNNVDFRVYCSLL